MTTKATGRSALERGVFIHVSCGILGIRRKVSTDNIEVKNDRSGEEVDKNQLSVNKAIIDCEEYHLIRRAMNDAKSWLAERAIHVPYYREGHYFIPEERGAESLEGLKTWREKIEKLADDFAFKAYAKAKREAKTRLGRLYVESEYPSERRVRASIYIEWTYSGGDEVPERLRKFGGSVYETAVKKAAEKAETLVEQMKYAMRQQLQELITHLADRLSPDDKGERKVFRQSAITNVTEWLEFFDSKNTITTDGRMADLVSKLKKQLSGIDVESLKDDEKFREQLQKDMTQVKSSLDSLLKDKPKRLIAARDEEV